MANLSHFCSINLKISHLGDWQGTCSSIQRISGNSLKFPNFLDSKSYVVQQLLKQLMYSRFGDNNLVPFHFWPAEIMLKCEKVCKYFFSM